MAALHPSGGLEPSVVPLPDDRPTPVPFSGYRLAYLRRIQPGQPQAVLLCDPLTGLVAYPSFEAHLQDTLPALVPAGVHLAIGDVDDLRTHVMTRRTSDPTAFGHLAGNDCMRRVGAVTRAWAGAELAAWPFSLCGTFGGDEVIVAAAGRLYPVFAALVRRLADDLRASAPRPCSFATATIASPRPADVDGAVAYRTLVATVDEALFATKAELRARGAAPNGDVVDVGAIDLCPTAAHSASPAAGRTT